MGHVTYSQHINASPEKVWAVVSNVTRFPEWAYNEGRYPYPVECRYGGEQTGGVGTLWVGVSGDEQIATYKITAWEPDEKMVYELVETENAPMQMSQVNTLDIESDNGGTTVTWAVDWELTGGFSLSSLLIRLTGNGSFEEMIAGSLENLKELVEKEATPESE